MKSPPLQKKKKTENFDSHGDFTCIYHTDLFLFFAFRDITHIQDRK